ncbi:deoxyribodipyrimidine photolyase [Polyangium jinanense]|uniref:Deoxyribodipyrimidine photo-lyase n=1 Tax=Polyangium jinanense TaxID=2829994 RepID=A0A9X4AUA5_9BACT|nr:deoxyribodipyrimidine photolyase [Polyangium jinanense]MDC3958645.1 deoxyribodipyrimidine photolyase [Polyangium jinanense]MDC3983047.1 deoxyribodipyrimidine photolyase [Polyangium jinanense]
MTNPDTLLPDSRVPSDRVRLANDRELRPDGAFVLYWMTASRRTHFNFGLERAAEWARALGRPLVVLEALRAGYLYASDRLHAFVLRGMADNARRLAEARVTHHAYVEPRPGAGKGLVAALAGRACVVVTDDDPTFFLPRMIAAAAKQVPVRFEQVDSNGLLPIHAPERVFTTAFSFRGYLQKNLLPHLRRRPLADPLAAGLPVPPKNLLAPDLLSRWPAASPDLLAASPAALAALPIDHTVPIVTRIPGGPEAARAALARFLQSNLIRYETERNDPDARATSGLSPYLHFGHISTHEIFAELERLEHWSEKKTKPAGGKREGFWGMSAPVESFLDELVTWREIGLNLCALRPDDAQSFDSLPDWALKTLADHESDPRPALYTLAELEGARTADPLWNAAQRELLRDGRIHNYLRMLWGKRVLEWSRSPREALSVLIHLNDKYALDGRDPNSYSGILWTFGRYDRPWAPERPVYGTVRYMSSANTLKKIDLERYLVEFGSPSDAARRDKRYTK